MTSLEYNKHYIKLFSYQPYNGQLNNKVFHFINAIEYNDMDKAKHFLRSIDRFFDKYESKIK